MYWLGPARAGMPNRKYVFPRNVEVEALLSASSTSTGETMVPLEKNKPI